VPAVALFAGMLLLALVSVPGTQATAARKSSATSAQQGGCMWQGQMYHSGSWAHGPQGAFQCMNGQWCKGGCGGGSGGGGGSCMWEGQTWQSGSWAQGPQGAFQCMNGQWCKGGCGGGGGWSGRKLLRAGMSV